MTSEANIQKQVWLEVGKRSKIFRINTGRAWVSGGKPASRTPDGNVIVPFGRPVALGFAYPNGNPVNGTPDLVGWTPLVITPEMVGHTVAVFTAIETKNSKGGRVSPDQQKYIDLLSKDGGIAGVANSIESVRAVFVRYLAKFEYNING